MPVVLRLLQGSHLGGNYIINATAEFSRPNCLALLQAPAAADFPCVGTEHTASLCRRLGIIKRSECSLSHFIRGFRKLMEKCAHRKFEYSLLKTSGDSEGNQNRWNASCKLKRGVRRISPPATTCTGRISSGKIPETPWNHNAP